MEMTGSSFALNPRTQDAPTVASASQPSAPAHRFSFGDFLDIVNPLQHLPVVGTLYRALTGDKIGTAEKIVGDGIYGGVWGLVSSVADAGFEAATGRNFGDTVLSLFTGHHDAPATAVAGARQSPPAYAHVAPTAVAQATTPDVAALTASLNAHGFDHDTMQRALAAYRRMSMPGYAN